VLTELPQGVKTKKKGQKEGKNESRPAATISKKQSEQKVPMYINKNANKSTCKWKKGKCQQKVQWAKKKLFFELNKEKKTIEM